MLVFAAIAIAAPVKIIREQGEDDAQPTGEESAQQVVKMQGLKFAPGTLTVRKGATVTFDNDDVAPHTVTETGGGVIDSGLLKPGQTFDLVVDKPLEYFCAVHPAMKAAVELTG